MQNSSKEKISKEEVKQALKTWGLSYVDFLKKRWWLLLIEGLVLAITLIADLLSKKYVSDFLFTLNGQYYPLAPGFIVFEYSENTGAGFGIFKNNTTALIAVTMIVIIGVLAYLLFVPHKNEWLRMSLVLIVGGGIGNNVDRINLGYVRDFIKYDFLKNFAICNVADVFVTVGVVMLIIVLIVMLVVEGRKNKKEFEEAKKAAGGEEYHEDPLDAPINLNPMMESPNDYTFVEPTDAPAKSDAPLEPATEPNDGAASGDEKIDTSESDSNL